MADVKRSAEKVISDLLLTKQGMKENTAHYPTSMLLSLDTHLDLCIEFYTLEGVESEFKHLLKSKVITRKEYKDCMRKARKKMKGG